MQQSKYDDRIWKLSWRKKEENQGKRKMKARSWLNQWMAGTSEAKKLRQGDKENK